MTSGKTADKPTDTSPSGEVERNLRLLARGGLTLFAALAVTLFAVQLFLGRQMNNLEEIALARQGALADLESAVSTLFQRETQMLSATRAAELAPLADRSAVEAQFARARTALGLFVSGTDGEALRSNAEDMLAADQDLFASLVKRHELQSRFEKTSGEVSAQLRTTMEEVNAISGIAHLGFIRILRRLSASGAGSAGGVRELVQGPARAEQEIAADLVGHILNLGVLVGKIALAPHGDALTSVMANEIAQNVAATRDRLVALEGLGGRQPEVVLRGRVLGEAYEAIIPRIVAEDASESMVALRRATFAQQKVAEELRQSTLAAARSLTATVARVRAQVKSDAAQAVSRAHVVTWFARLVSFLWLCAGVWLLVQAARRIRASFEGLRANNQALATLKEELVGVNANLEGLVAERTAALGARERAMRLILDHTADGLMTIDLDGRLSGELSQAARRWFGEPGPDQPAATYLFGGTPVQPSFELAFSQVADDVLPFGVSAEELPARLVRAGRSYALAYSEIRDGERLRGVLLSVRDVTEEEAIRRREEDAREMQTMIGHILHSPQGFRTFLDETERFLETMAKTDSPAVVRHALHTLKGSAAIYGVMKLARFCHDLESLLAAGAPWERRHVEDIAVLWEQILANLGQFVPRDRDLIDVTPGDIDMVQAMLRERVDHGDILELVRSWSREPIRSILERLGAQAKRMALGLGKEVQVHVDCDNVRPAKVLAPFLSSLVHVIRNAVDHGIEPASERAARGKPAQGLLSLSFRAQGPGFFELVLADDGGGVDFARLREKAEQVGLPHETESQLLEALFADGLSTRDEVTELSGRGVGLGAVRDAVASFGGRIDVASGPAGTVFRFAIPASKVREEGVALPPTAEPRLGRGAPHGARS